MPTLRQLLESLPHRDLRGIATRLNVRHRDENRKEAWIAAIWNAWHNPERQAQLLARLSPAARQAALRLALSGELPAALFLAEYGPVRRPRPGQHWAPPPWEQPATISEELYYCGLLAPAEDLPLERAGRLAIPADLASLFRTAAEAPPPPPSATNAADTLTVLLHDVAQTLCFLAGAEGVGSLRLLHDRWLPPAPLADLNRRLRRAQPVPPRSHARSHWPRFLFFLITAADLQQAGRLTAVGWSWLAEPPAARLTRLWDAWRTAPLSLRRAYRQPTAALPEPWPDLALKHLAALPAPFTAGQLAQTVLGRERSYTAYFAAHLADLSDLDAATADLLAALAGDWGLLAATSGAAGPMFRLTDPGRWLLAGAQGDPPVPLSSAAGAAAAHLQVDEAGHWQLHVPDEAPPIHLAHLAPYARYEAHAGAPSPSRPERSASSPPPTAEEDRGTGAAFHIYRLDADTVAAAAAAGHGLPTLLDALAGLGLQLDSARLADLHAWHARGRRLEIVHLPLLRAADRETLAQVMAHPEVRGGLGDLLSPTVAALTIPPDELADRLRAAGFFPQLPAPSPQPPAPGPQSSAPGPQPPAPGPQPPAPNPQSSAALWLAGQLYAAFGELMPLPLPPPFSDLAALLASLSPAGQAAVRAQWEALRSAWRAALDGQTYAPPPQPTDPARWRPAIEAAIAAGRSLTIRYFTAGRNVLTERTVTPYWIEEHRGIPYLRADCHLAGRVRLFRLDRIVELEEWVEG